MIHVTCEVIEPLHLAESHTVSPSARTLDYIPGSAWRGALAAEYLRRQKTHKPDQRFNSLFLAEGCWFTPLTYCASRDVAPAFPIPMTAYTCKAHQNWNEKGKVDKDHHGARDLLFELLHSENELPIDTCDREGCGSKLIQASGFYSPNKGIVEPLKRFITHTAVDPRSETAAARQLYTQEVIQEGQFFGGDLCLPDAEEKIFQQEFLKEGQEYRLGAGRSRGQGLIRIAKSEVKPKDDPNRQGELIKNIHEFTKMSGLKENLFTLLLLSDCILLDSALQPTVQLKANHLAQFGHPDLVGVMPIQQFCQASTVDGWNEAHHMLRSQTVVLRGGSVFAFQSTLPVAKLATYLCLLEQGGVGERRQEGFGRVLACSGFHKREVQE